MDRGEGINGEEDKSFEGWRVFFLFFILRVFFRNKILVILERYYIVVK